MPQRIMAGETRRDPVEHRLPPGQGLRLAAVTAANSGVCTNPEQCRGHRSY
jgi:hypothetical protein